MIEYLKDKKENKIIEDVWGYFEIWLSCAVACETLKADDPSSYMNFQSVKL